MAPVTATSVRLQTFCRVKDRSCQPVGYNLLVCLRSDTTAVWLTHAPGPCDLRIRAMMQHHIANLTSRPQCAVYNDEDPESGEEYFARAHAKGIVLAHNGSVTWLQHSVPKFPLANASYAHAQAVYGQHFFCLKVQCAFACFNLIRNMLAASCACPQRRCCFACMLNGCVWQCS